MALSRKRTQRKECDYVGIYCENSILNKCSTNKEFLETFYDCNCKKRPQTDVKYRPRTYRDGESVDCAGCDIGRLYPDFEEGDYVYLSSSLDGLFEREILIDIWECNDTPDVWFNGEKINVIQNRKIGSGDICFDAPVTFKKGKNKLVVRVKAGKDAFSVKISPLIPESRMDTFFYVYCSWLYIDAEGFYGQKGVRVSRLYKKDEPVVSANKIEWVYPALPRQSNEKVFDFTALCGKGVVAYSYTHVCGCITFQHDSPITIFERGTAVYSADNGIFSKVYSEPAQLLIRARKGENGWGFKSYTKGEHSLPFVEGADCPDLQWLWIGPFGNEADGKNEPYGPECNLQFEDTYSSVYGCLYWHFYRENTVLIQTVFSNFYGQWFYPMMVGLHGMKLAAAKLGREKEFVPYFKSWMKIFVQHIDYGRHERAESRSWTRYLSIAGKLDNLDSIGTIGINVAEYCMMTADREAKYLLQLLADSISYAVPRFSDGTFNRTKTMWTDDTYMSLPFLARLGAMTGEERYFDDILMQIRGFSKRMWMEEEGLFSHIYFVEEKTANRIPWGRGNGWALLALSEVLLLLPKEYHGYNEILSVFRKFTAGVIKHRDKKEGLWHQVVNNPESYIEASGSAMFITALARGVRKGWLDASVADTVKDAWRALLYNCVDEEGNLYGVCMGSSCSMEEKYYLKLGTIKNDDHGCGIVLGACVEVMNMLGEQ